MYYKNQGIFVQDFPLKVEGADVGGQTAAGDDWLRDDFERSLCEYLSQYRSVGLDVVELVRRFDYSAASAVLIPSAPGTWAAREMSRWGHVKVRTVLQRELMVDADMQRQPIIAQFSSIGSIQQKVRGAAASLPLSLPPAALLSVWPCPVCFVCSGCWSCVVAWERSSSPARLTRLPSAWCGRR